MRRGRHTLNIGLVGDYPLDEESSVKFSEAFASLELSSFFDVSSSKDVI